MKYRPWSPHEITTVNGDVIPKPTTYLRTPDAVYWMHDGWLYHAMLMSHGAAIDWDNSGPVDLWNTAEQRENVRATAESILHAMSKGGGS